MFSAQGANVADVYVSKVSHTWAVPQFSVPPSPALSDASSPPSFSGLEFSSAASTTGPVPESGGGLFWKDDALDALDVPGALDVLVPEALPCELLATDPAWLDVDPLGADCELHAGSETSAMRPMRSQLRDSGRTTRVAPTRGSQCDRENVIIQLPSARLGSREGRRRRSIITESRPGQKRLIIDGRYD
jgi:hypothetical protein